MRKPVQVYLDETDLRRLDAWAWERRWTKSQAIRLAVRALTRPRGGDPILELSGMFQGLPPDVCDNFDRYLSETYVAEHGSIYKASRRPTRRLRR
jgi:hypothetical protein